MPYILYIPTYHIYLSILQRFFIIYMQLAFTILFTLQLHLRIPDLRKHTIFLYIPTNFSIVL